MKQLSKIFFSLALLTPVVTFADNSCNTATTTNNCSNNSGCNTNVNNTSNCNTSCCFNSATTSVCNTSCDTKVYCPSVFIKRPTYDNTVIQYGLDYQHRYDMDQVYGGFQLAFEYQRSFESARLAQGMFGSNVLNFAGSQVANPAPNSLLADNFGLSQAFQGSIALRPIIQSVNLFFDWYVGFDEWAPGLFLQFDMNFEYQQRQLQYDCKSTSVTTTGAQFPAGYMNVSTSPVAPVTAASATAILPTALGLQQTFGDKKNPTSYGRWDFSERNESGLAGLSVNFGYDFVRCDDYFLGAFFRVVAPTGSSVQPCYVFDPIVGNGKGWELGAGISSRWEIWNNNDCQKLTAMLDGYCTSILKHHSVRTFDLASTNTALAVNYLNCPNSCNTSCNANNTCAISANSCNTPSTTSSNSCNVANATTSCNLNSCSTGCGTNSCNNTCNTCNALNCLTRYNLLKQYSVANGVYTYANNLITAADFTTRNVEVSTPAKGEATVRLVYTHGGFEFGFGYNVFGMQREKVASVGSQSICSTNTGNVYAVKGCQGVAYNQYAINDFGFASSTITQQFPLINSSSQSTAYVSGNCGSACVTPDNAVIVQSNIADPGYLNVTYNSNNNNATIPGAAITGSNTAPLVNGVAATVPQTSGANGSAPVVLVGSPNELDLCSGTAPRQFANRGFMSLDYTWVDNDWAPYLGFIAEVEGGSRNLDLAQWGVVIRGGVSY